MAAVSAVVLRCAGRQAVQVWELVAPTYAGVPCYVWDDSAQAVAPPLQSFPLLGAAMALPGVLHVYVSLGDSEARRRVVAGVRERFPHAVFPNVVHPRAFISPSATLGQGNFIGALAVVNTGARVGDFCIVNTAADVDHDVVLEDYVTVNPGAILAGSARVGIGATVGANACVRDRVDVPAGVVVGMQAAVVKSTPCMCVCVCECEQWATDLAALRRVARPRFPGRRARDVAHARRSHCGHCEYASSLVLSQAVQRGACAALHHPLH